MVQQDEIIMEEHQSDEEDQDQQELRDYQESRNRVQRQTKVRYMGYRVSNDRNTNTTVTTGNSQSTSGGGIMSGGTQFSTTNYRSSSQMGVTRAMSQNRGTWNQQQHPSASHNAQTNIMNMVDEEEQSKDPNGKYRKSRGEEKQRSNSNNYRLSNTIINDAYGDETIQEALEYVSPYTIMNECGYTIEIQAQEDKSAADY